MKRIELLNIEKTYFIENPKTGHIYTHPALSGVSVGFESGKITSLLGENGAGKSTLVHILSGRIKQTNGTIKIDGKPCSFSNCNDAIKKKISIVLQSLPLPLEASIFENFMMGKIENSSFCTLKKTNLKHEIFSLFKYWGITNIDFNKKIKEFSKEKQFFIELVNQLYKKPSLLILDESTSFIPSNKRDIFFNKLKNYAQNNDVAIINITHDTLEAINISDKIIIIKDGKNANTFDMNVLRQTKKTKQLLIMIKNCIFGEKQNIIRLNQKDVIKNYSKNIVSYEKENNTKHLNFKIEFTNKNSIFKNLKIEAINGEILGIFFITNPYIKILEDILSGMHYINEMPHYEGGITLLESLKLFIPFNKITPNILLKNKIGFLPSDRYYRASHSSLSIKEMLSCYSTQKMWINGKKQLEEAEAILKEERIDSSCEESCNTLSGGQLQRLILARCLKENPNIIILFEPFKGLDFISMEIIGEKLTNLSKNGKTILIFSQEENNEVYKKLLTKQLVI